MTSRLRKHDLARLTVEKDATVLEALKAIDAGGEAITFVVDGSGRVIGCLTDGDIRYHTDFRRVYATLLDDWLGVDSKGVLGDKFEKLALIDRKKKAPAGGPARPGGAPPLPPGAVVPPPAVAPEQP